MNNLSTIQAQPNKFSVRALQGQSWLFWQIVAVCAAGILLGGVVISNQFVNPEYYPLLLIAALVPFVLMIFGNIKKLLLIGIILEIPIQLDQSFFYNDLAADYSAIGGLNISVTTICLAALYVLWGLELLSKKESLPTNWARWSTILASSFLAITAASMFYASDFMLAMFGFNHEAQAFLLFVYIAFRLRTDNDVQMVVKALVVTLLIQSVIMLILAAVGDSFYVGSIYFRIDFGTRVGGTAGGSNSTAGILIILLSLTFSTLLTHLEAHWKLIAITTFGLGVCALLLTFSRGGWIGFTAAMIVFYMGAFRMRWVSLAFPFVSLVVVAGLAAIFGEIIIERIFGDDGGAAQGRVPLMYIAAYMIQDHPWFGVGVNNFTQAWSPYLTPEFTGAWLHTVHNKYLLIWSETGVFGFITFFSFLFSIIRISMWVVGRNTKALLSPLSLGILAGLVGVLVHMNVEILTGRPQIQFLWLICGLGVAIYNIERAKQASNAESFGHLIYD